MIVLRYLFTFQRDFIYQVIFEMNSEFCLIFLHYIFLFHLTSHNQEISFILISVTLIEIEIEIHQVIILNSLFFRLD
jgi:hypothetical protein